MTGTVLITGGSSGIGYHAVQQMATYPDIRIVSASRTPPPDLAPNAVYIPLDLSSRLSVRQFVTAWSYGPISALILNAGLFPGGPPEYTSEGIEMSLAVNHLHHALLFFLLKDKHQLSDDCRIIVNTTSMHDPKAPLAPFTPFWQGSTGGKTDTGTVSGTETGRAIERIAAAKEQPLQNPGVRYATTKLVNVLWAYALTRHLRASGKGRAWKVIIFDPGWAPGNGSRLARDHSPLQRFAGEHIMPRMLWLLRMFGAVTATPQIAGRALTHLALGEEYSDISMSGKHLTLEHEHPSSADSYDEAQQDEVWDWTIETLAKDERERESFAL